MARTRTQRTEQPSQPEVTQERGEPSQVNLTNEQGQSSQSRARYPTMLRVPQNQHRSSMASTNVRNIFLNI